MNDIKAGKILINDLKWALVTITQCQNIMNHQHCHEYGKKIMNLKFNIFSPEYNPSVFWME